MRFFFAAGLHCVEGCKSLNAVREKFLFVLIKALSNATCSVSIQALQIFLHK
jgi:hypothetical protein